MIIGLIMISLCSLLVFIGGLWGLIVGIKEKEVAIIILSLIAVIIGLGFSIGFIGQLITV
ncbi:TPA: hypothetical protein ACXDAY_002148 [Clostridium botulinum]|uniref:hypothetical protein n=1 Tax=Clostridium botulinum TaxID=1491 RepID=UPI0004646F40|nr:hypothetical protein [Clostridium botulinum]APH20836.1 putative membrane protein [Clostridium botulinum]APQ71299.1 putative membrane protein [Clostridium botulinum]APR02342.1 putative membrane protein [Clostridium botulinum]AUN01560.1 hypothetical protein RSJ19_00835 [Clostridium botulinum]MBN3359278.1 hypothetical protein [Clostridium botulinum]